MGEGEGKKRQDAERGEGECREMKERMQIDR
jgi:hypothetical protein